MRIFKRIIIVSPGFSTVEILVVVAIISIMAAIAIPNFLAYLPKSRLSGAARVIAGDLAAARMAAVKQNCRASITFNSDNHSYYIWVDENNDSIQDAGEISTKDLHPEYHDVVYDADLSTAVNERIGFSSRGTGSGIGKFVIKNSGDSKYIVVNLAGRVRIS